MIASTINLTIFIMMIIIYLNEMRNISMFIFNFNYIKDLSKIVMEQKCNNIYCEAETDRYQIAKNSYNLRMPNDIFNSKTYTIFVFIISIMIFIYYHCILFDIQKSSADKIGYFIGINILLLVILLIMIIYRYVPNDDTGYENYFKETPSWLGGVIIVLLFLIGIILYMINNDYKNFITYLCYILSLIILLNLMNIVMTFRTNTKPMLKTKLLLWSIKKSIKILIEKFKEDNNKSLDDLNVDRKLKEEFKILEDLNNYHKTTKTNIAYFIKIIAAFKELSKIYFKSLSTDAAVNEYIIKLKKDIKDNHENIKKDNVTTAETNISELSLIFDKETNLPITYDGDEHSTNANTMNADYKYTADISYDSPNLFYEKYWGMNEIGNDFFPLIPSFLYKYEHFTPTFLFGSYKPTLFKIFILIILFIAFIYAVLALLNYSQNYIQPYSDAYETMKPLIMFAILIIYIIFFISFNTQFNKYVVYKCLDSSYKRSLNKLNNITTPYIRLYDNKIVSGNKNYLRNYIITNVFYSLLNGNIRLNDDSNITKVYGAIQTTIETQIKMREIINLIIKLPDYYYKGIVPTISNKLDEFNSKRTGVTGTIMSINTLLNNIKTYISEISGISSTITELKEEITTAINAIIEKITGVSPVNSVKIYIDAKTLANDTLALTLAKKIDIDLSQTLIDIENLKTELLKIYANDKTLSSEAINSKDDYYDIPKIKSSRLQFANINSDNLSDEDGFRDYYKGTFKDIYNKQYNPENVTKLYKVFEGLFADNGSSEIDDYFKGTIITRNNVMHIYYIIKKCFNLFDESKFNSNLVYYNDAENKQKGINISSSYNKFSFQKYNNKIIPYKFVLKLKTSSDREEFTKDLQKDESEEFDVMMNSFGITTTTTDTDTTKILDNNEDDLLNQASDIEKKQNKNLIKIIAKYLLILGHINYNRIEYSSSSKTPIDKREIYEKKTYKLYKLISDTLYNDTYDIDDTFSTAPISSFTISSPGSGYQTNPSVTINGDTSIAAATASSGVITAVTLNPGKGGQYITPPSVIIGAPSSSSGTTATAIAVLGAFTNLPIPDTDAYKRYKNLTYIYNYLETKYVSISSNNNNSNYLMNIIKSINNKINDDDKTFKNVSKDARYLFRDYIDRKENKEDYENEEEILTIANNISTTTLGGTYIFNILLLIIVALVLKFSKVNNK